MTICKAGEIQKDLVKSLRSLANQIERSGVIETSVSYTVEIMSNLNLFDDTAQFVVHEPTLERKIYLHFIFAKPPTFTEDDSDA